MYLVSVYWTNNLLGQLSWRHPQVLICALILAYEPNKIWYTQQVLFKFQQALSFWSLKAKKKFLVFFLNILSSFLFLDHNNKKTELEYCKKMKSNVQRYFSYMVLFI